MKKKKILPLIAALSLVVGPVLAMKPVTIQAQGSFMAGGKVVQLLITHSAGGGSGWETAIRSDKVKAVISLEPGAFPFPEGEVPPTEETTSLFPAVGEAVSMENFLRLTKIPIVVYFGELFICPMLD